MRSLDHTRSIKPRDLKVGDLIECCSEESPLLVMTDPETDRSRGNHVRTLIMTSSGVVYPVYWNARSRVEVFNVPLSSGGIRDHCHHR